MITVHDPAFHEPSYEAGYSDGESSCHADYVAALDEIPGFEWPRDDFYPSDVVAVIRALLAAKEEKP